MRLPILAPILAALPAPAALGAQVAVADQSHAWLSHFGDYLLTDRLALYQEVFLRRAEEGATWQQRHFAQGVTLTLGKAVRVTAGHTYVHTSAYGELPGAAGVDENRAWAQVQLAHATGKLRWIHRTRGEYRWIEARPAWTRTARWRQQLRLVYPVGTKSYLTAGGESFVRLSPAAQEGDLEQSRLTAAVGRTVATGTSLELGYLHQRLRRAREREHNHTLVVNVRAAWRVR